MQRLGWLVLALLWVGCGSDGESPSASDAGVELPDGDQAEDAGPELQADPEPFPPDLAAALQAALDEGFPDLEAPGAVLGVTLPGHLPWAAAAGLADVEAERPVTAEDRFRIGSITKTFTSALILRLVDEGRLELDAAVDDVLPGYDLGPEVTVRRLLDHTSGIFNLTDDPNFLGFGLEFRTPDEVIRWALEHEAPVAPGTVYHYSNTNFFLAGLIVESLFGVPFHVALRQELLEPLGLADTFLDGPEDPEMVEGYVAGTLATDSLDMSLAWAAGAGVSTVADLCAWARLLFEGEVLSAATTAEMIGPSVDASPEPGAYGLGVRHLSRRGVQVVGHTGSTMGFVSELFYHRDSGACVAILANDFLGKRLPVVGPAWQQVGEHLGL